MVTTWQGAVLPSPDGPQDASSRAALEKQGQQGCGNCRWEKQGQCCPGIEEQPGEPRGWSQVSSGAGAAAWNGNGQEVAGRGWGCVGSAGAPLGSTLTLPAS